MCRLSVTFVYPTQAIEIFGNISTPAGTLAVCWHPGKILRRSSQGNPSDGGVKHKRGELFYDDIDDDITFDDTNLFFSGNDIDPLAKSVNLELEKISDWFKANKLSMNIKKTHFILFRTKNKKILSNVSI